MKKSIFFIILFSFFASAITADDLANILQDLAVQIACLGRYSTAQTGVYVTSRYNDPTDWYDPPMMANRFAAMSGNMTRTITFYGVCFDYAQFAWDYINANRKIYNNAGMKGNQWYIAVTKPNDPYNITLYTPATKENSTTVMNGVYLKENSRYNVHAHDRATGHAWIWVQHNNGTWYWIDPTWTDNTGYVWWGIVKNGEEIQYDPDPKYCVASNYPKSNRTNPTPSGTPPKPNKVPSSPPPSSGSGSISYYNSNYLLFGYNYVNGIPLGFTIADSMYFERSLIYISFNFSNFDIYSKIENTIEWTYGISFAINNFIRIPIGIGGNHTLIPYTEEYISGSNGYGHTYSTKTTSKWEHALVLEIGIQPVLFDRFYLSATYRLIGFSKSGFTIGAGFIF